MGEEQHEEQRQVADATPNRTQLLETGKRLYLEVMRANVDWAVAPECILPEGGVVYDKDGWRMTMSTVLGEGGRFSTFIRMEYRGRGVWSLSISGQTTLKARATLRGVLSAAFEAGLWCDGRAQNDVTVGGGRYTRVAAKRKGRMLARFTSARDSNHAVVCDELVELVGVGRQILHECVLVFTPLI
ncbi:MAG: hypothetical protein B7X04_01095 [Parcubacteria group bacterium 21-54-25]|nr:MAG: hypothetical protein B7X04_01095 [Parcubacteria group bacterium 21-54-25]HQU07829.1 hypothetical protein [Candidatus Paceibacterota bacterium]